MNWEARPLRGRSDAPYVKLPQESSTAANEKAHTGNLSEAQKRVRMLALFTILSRHFASHGR